MDYTCWVIRQHLFQWQRHLDIYKERASVEMLTVYLGKDHLFMNGKVNNVSAYFNEVYGPMWFSSDLLAFDGVLGVG